jgi:hypothetical protein
MPSSRKGRRGARVFSFTPTASRRRGPGRRSSRILLRVVGHQTVLLIYSCGEYPLKNARSAPAEEPRRTLTVGLVGVENGA